MPIPLIIIAAAAASSVVVVGAAVYTSQEMQRRNSPAPSGSGSSGGSIPQSAPDYDGRAEPLARQAGSKPLPTELQTATTTAATADCADCPVCGFLASGYKINSYIPFRPALDYQDRVVRLLGMSMPPFVANIATGRTEEWQMPDANSGNNFRPFDGLASLPCFLIEAKLGYSSYLVDNFAGSMPEVADTSRASGIMTKVSNQIFNHNRVAMRYPRRPGPHFKHMVIWGVSQMIMMLYVNGLALRGNPRVRAFHIPAKMLPASIW